MLNLLILLILLFTILTILHRQRLLFAFTTFSSHKLTPLQRILLFIASSLLFITLWNYIAQLESEGINKIPTPGQTLLAAKDLTLSGKLPTEAGISCLRVLIGLSAAALIGTTLGLLAGSFLLFNRIIVPVTSFLRYIPPTAFISLLIVYFGIGETYKYAVIFFCVIFFIIQMVIDTVEDLDKRYIEMALTSGYSHRRTFKEVIMPASWPRIWDVLRINLSASWTFLVAAELIGAENGLGHLIAMSQRYLRMEDLYVAILTFGIIGLITDRSLEWLSRKLFPWHNLGSQ